MGTNSQIIDWMSNFFKNCNKFITTNNIDPLLEKSLNNGGSHGEFNKHSKSHI